MPESSAPFGNSNDDPLSTLNVFDRLEVGPVKLERRRLVAPYRLFHGDQAEQTELIYTYEEDVFDPERPESRNLADMIAAQVALNYGLFCREIVFNGLFDKTDRQFLREMAENTAREIFVKKFLEPNPFLVGDAARLPAVKPKAYLRARLSFPVTVRTHHQRPWKTDPSRHCVLSSGGKDSLLSFGLLDDMGREVHPIFVNESGRHWYTALNAYRHFRDNIPNTARVWVNADRLYPWMLRRMPFIRKDFASVRADEYPIRLWTVAVFLFGVLPLLRKRGIGRLIIGDEFDTSRRVTTQGIRHYDGLYDQSIWFDTALSRYFMRKGWSLSQFSMLRPLSELLIEKILVKRYTKYRSTRPAVTPPTRWASGSNPAASAKSADVSWVCSPRWRKIHPVAATAIRRSPPAWTPCLTKASTPRRRPKRASCFSCYRNAIMSVCRTPLPVPSNPTRKS
jgi:hypothetical protein